MPAFVILSRISPGAFDDPKDFKALAKLPALTGMHRQRRWLQRLGRNFSRPSSGCVEQCKKPRWRVGAFGSFASVRAFRGGCPYRSCPPQIPLLALGAAAIHRSRLEAALFQPALDPVFGEADI